MFATACALTCLIVATQSKVAYNFDSGDGQAPTGWATHTWAGEATFKWSGDGRSGRCAQVTSVVGADAGWTTRVPVIPRSTYHVTVWVKTVGVQNTTGRGAQINLEGIDVKSGALTGDNDWTQLAIDFATHGQTAVQINCLFGGWGKSTGTAYWDDLVVERTGEVKVPPLRISIDASHELAPIRPEIYGQFIEHLGRCIYGGIWAEMLEDRKFFFPVTATYAPYGQADHQDQFPPLVASPWQLEGDSTGVSKVADRTYREEPLLRIDPARAKSIAQHGLGLVAGKEYVGRVVARGTGTLTVTLEGHSKVVTVRKSLTRTDFTFKADRSTDNGTLGLKLGGTGHVDVAAVSLMPSDNVEGFRADTLALLKRLDSPLYRWPGGNFVSGYDWHDGLGDPDRRPTRTNPAWSGIETNDMGTHEFIRLARLLHTAPLIVVNTGFGSPYDAGQWVEYCNGKATTAMGKLRAANGSPEPFNVHWWGVGNEMYGEWQLGYMDFAQYATKHNMTVSKMRLADPTIKLVASGAPGRFNDTIIPLCAVPGNLDLISAHFYAQSKPDVTDHVWFLRDGIRDTLKAYRGYADRFPGLHGKNIPVCFDEWNYWYGPQVFGELGTHYFLKDGLGVAAALHEFFRNSDLVEVAMYAQTVNVIGAIKTDKTAADMETTGLVLEMYRKYYGSKPVKITSTAEPNDLDIAAALSADGKVLTVGVVNPGDKEVEVPFAVTGFTTGACDIHWVGGSDPMAYNIPRAPAKIAIHQRRISAVQKLSVPPYSATVARYKKG